MQARVIWPSGAEGSRTLTCPLKRRKRCRYATTPSDGVGVCVSVEMGVALLLSLFRVVSCRGSPGWSRTNRQRHIRSSCFRYNTGPQSGRWESNPRSRAPDRAGRGPPLPYLPKSYAASSSSYGSRTHLSVLKGRNPQTDRRTSRMLFPPVGREALESSSPGLQPGAIPSQLPTRILKQFNEKRPGVAVTPGLQVVRILGLAERHRRNGNRRLSAASAE